MSELRILVNKTNREGVVEKVDRVDAGRVRVKFTDAKGTTLATRIFTNAEWAAHKKADTAFEAAAPPPPPPPVDPPPTQPPVPLPGIVRPYDARSAWNTPLGANPVVLPTSAARTKKIAEGSLLTCDPTQYSGPLYLVDDSMPKRTVRINGYRSLYSPDEWSRSASPKTLDVPWPQKVTPSSGSDGHAIFWDVQKQIVRFFWNLNVQAMTADNGVESGTGPGWYGTYFDGLAGRGGGTSYLAGIVTRKEMDAALAVPDDKGVLNHALAFMTPYTAGPETNFVYPAAKTDGDMIGSQFTPEGTLFQLLPSWDISKLSPWGRVLARTLKVYGMYTIDTSGRNKLYLEDGVTSGWGKEKEMEVAGLPLATAFREVACPAAKPAKP